jgi:hypothetical protein
VTRVPGSIGRHSAARRDISIGKLPSGYLYLVLRLPVIAKPAESDTLRLRLAPVWLFVVALQHGA